MTSTSSSRADAERLDVVYKTGEKAVDFSLSEHSQLDEAMAKGAAESGSKSVTPICFPVKTDRTRDDLLTDFGKETLDDRYLLPGETYQDLFARVASAYADDADHAQRVYDYI